MPYEQRLDPPEPYEVSSCVYCGGEIYAGDEVKRIDDGGGFVHSGWGRSCAAEYAMERVYDAEGVITRNGDVE